MPKDPSPRKRRKAKLGDNAVTSVTAFFPVDQMHKDKVERNRWLKHRASRPPLPPPPPPEIIPTKDDARKRSKSDRKDTQHRNKTAKKQKSGGKKPKATKNAEAPKTHNN